MEEIELEIEAPQEVAPALAESFREHLGLRIEVTVVPDRSLPRFELKAQRVVDRRGLR